MNQTNKNLKWLWISIAVFVVGVLGVSLGFLIHARIYSARVEIMVVPSIAKVKIGDAEFSSYGEFALKPGEYTVEVSADGFATKTGKLVARADEAVDLNLYLESNSESTKNWYTENSGDALILGEIKNNETMDAVAELLTREPVLKELPLTVEFYSNDYSNYTKYVISYELDDSDRGFYLIMKDYTGTGMGAAIIKLGEMGMNTVGLELKYENLEEDSLGGYAGE